MRRVLIAGGGIGGIAAALCLHQHGIDCAVFEQGSAIRELGVGINTLPHAIRELAALGLLPALDRAGIRTRELIYANRFGQTVWWELRGLHAGLDAPQFSIHRGKLLGVLHEAAVARGVEVHTGCRLLDFSESSDGVVARFEGGRIERGDALVGADGIHSAVRARFYPDEGPPRWTGTMLWRGAVEWPVFADGSTMLIAGGMRAKFVLYPIHADPTRPATRLTNWAVLARIASGDDPPPRREDWNRPGAAADLLPFVQDNFHLGRLGLLDPLELIAATGTFYEYPMCDRDPLPRWSFGRVTLLGDAAHPMYPVGSNGASQAVLDGVSLAKHLSSDADVITALAGYDSERRNATEDVVLNNRKGGPERVIDVIEERAPDGFADIDAVATHSEREAIVCGYAVMAGFAGRV
jgi:2-polyprenyl-6-methoxyphenol hydroxylase-like FAD-dependent oxidoreductase